VIPILATSQSPLKKPWFNAWSLTLFFFHFGDGALVAIIPKRINIDGNKLLGKSQTNGEFGSKKLDLTLGTCLNLADFLLGCDPGMLKYQG